jgi:hypothetical protein
MDGGGFASVGALAAAMDEAPSPAELARVTRADSKGRPAGVRPPRPRRRVRAGLGRRAGGAVAHLLQLHRLRLTWVPGLSLGADGGALTAGGFGGCSTCVDLDQILQTRVRDRHTL